MTGPEATLGNLSRRVEALERAVREAVQILNARNGPAQATGTRRPASSASEPRGSLAPPAAPKAAVGALLTKYTNSLPRTASAPLPAYLDSLAKRVDALAGMTLGLETALGVRALGADRVVRRPTGLHAYLDELEARVDALRSGTLVYEEARRTRVEAPEALPRVPQPTEVPWPRRAPLVVTTPLRYTNRRRVRRRWYPRGRNALALLLLLLLLPLLLAALLFGSRWRDNRQLAFAQGVLADMVEAPSYRATGRDTLKAPGESTEISEEFTFVSPRQVRTNFKVLSGRASTTDCKDLTIVVLNSDRYQNCADSSGQPLTWRTDTLDPLVFDTAAVRPWIRFLWCRDIVTRAQPELVDGEPTTVYSCRVKNEQEATVIWQKELQLDPLTRFDRDRFLREAVVNITLWVRHKDGYVGRFQMTKRFPVGEGIAEQEVEYRFTDFGQVEPIPSPVVAQDRPGPLTSLANT